MKFLVIALAMSACGPKPGPITPPNGSGSAVSAGDPSCPLEIDGTSIAFEDAAGGAVWVFVTTGDAAAVRERAGKLAAIHNARTATDGKLAPGCGGCMADTIEIPSSATVADVEKGAKITFIATKPADAETVADVMRMHGGHLAQGAGGTCKMGM